MADLTKHERSMLLTGAMGLYVSGSNVDQWGRLFVIVHPDRDDWNWVESVDYPLDLYASATMNLAWFCHLWMMMDENHGEEYAVWWEENSILIREDAQRLFLDKIFTICVEHNIIEGEDERETN